MHNRIKLIVASVFIAFACNAASGDITSPIGLSAGDQYRVAFVTEATGPATNSDLSFYDGFVSTQANAGSETAKLVNASWQVIGSSLADNANSHTATFPSLGGVPIFLVDGTTRVADDYSDLWDLSLQSPISLDQNGQFLDGVVFTGTSPIGARRMSRYFGGASGLVTTGDSTAANAGWTSLDFASSSTPHHFYGLSNIQTIAAVPEPSSIFVVAFSIGLLSLRRRVFSDTL